MEYEFEFEIFDFVFVVRKSDGQKVDDMHVPAE